MGRRCVSPTSVVTMVTLFELVCVLQIRRKGGVRVVVQHASDTVAMGVRARPPICSVVVVVSQYCVPCCADGGKDRQLDTVPLLKHE